MFSTWLTKFAVSDFGQRPDVVIRPCVTGSEPVACPWCGAPLSGRAGCQAQFDRLSGLAWTSPRCGAVHNLVVDTMQHPEEYCRSAKSYVQHLTALCCGLEAPDDLSLYWAIPTWLDGPAALERPADIAPRGTMTIADICTPANEDRYPELVRLWAHDVWTAYAVQHELAQHWLDAVRAHMVLGGVCPRG